MEGEYDVLLGSGSVGQAWIVRSGLYLQISCRCRLSGEVMHRVVVSCGGKQENLGILSPENGEFALSTKIPAKRLPKGTPVFHAMPYRQQSTERFAAIYPEEPFSYLQRLKQSYLEVRNGQIGLRFSESSNPTGQ